MLKYICSLFLSISFWCQANQNVTDITANMRPLVRVRDSVITVVDVMKKMDLVFFQQFPQFRTSTEKRFEFYQATWRQVLQDLVERKVIMLYADENKMEVGHGDIREEMEELFGPNVLVKLYDAGVSWDDAYDMIRQDIMMRRIIQFYVRMPAVASITPQKIKARFFDRYGTATRGDKLSWQILSVQASDSIDSKKQLLKIIDALNAKKTTVEQVKTSLPEGVEFSLSPLYVTEIEQLSKPMRSILEPASFNVWTAPYQGKEPKKGWSKWISYVVTARIPGEKVPLNLVENEITEELLQPLFDENRKNFLEGLIKKYDVTYCLTQKEMDEFCPFRIANASS